MRSLAALASLVLVALAPVSSAAAQEFDYRALRTEPTAERVAQVLAQVASKGRGNHHFLLSYCSAAPGVVLPPDVRTQHPVEITIVLEWQFEDLVVNDREIRVTVAFDRQPARIVIPIAALTGFEDPSVGLNVWVRPGDMSEARCRGVNSAI